MIELLKIVILQMIFSLGILNRRCSLLAEALRRVQVEDSARWYFVFVSYRAGRSTKGESQGRRRPEEK